MCRCSILDSCGRGGGCRSEPADRSCRVVCEPWRGVPPHLGGCCGADLVERVTEGVREAIDEYASAFPQRVFGNAEFSGGPSPLRRMDAVDPALRRWPGPDADPPPLRRRAIRWPARTAGPGVRRRSAGHRRVVSRVLRSSVEDLGAFIRQQRREPLSPCLEFFGRQPGGGPVGDNGANSMQHCVGLAASPQRRSSLKVNVAR